LFAALILHAQNSPSKQYSSKIPSSNKNKTINFNGQWKGGFDETSYNFAGLGGNNITYVLELTTEGSRVSGYSYTYFTEGPKRYYTICRLTGSLNRTTNEIVVTEIERTKYNTPPDFQNCFQTHRLHYEKGDDNTEFLRGTWIPAPNQGQGCGSGTTLLSRRIVNRLPLGIKPPINNNNDNNKVKAPVKKVAPKNQVVIAPKKTVPPVVKKPTEQKPQIEKNETVINDTPLEQKREINSKTIIERSPKLENRRKNIVRTIFIEQPTFRVDFYDNGEIDGDSITVFYNGKAVLSHKRLSDKPISLTLTLDKNASENEVVMYAENLGTIPPNTALMIVTDGSKRYEVRMESDLGKSGSVVFKHE
jgi:hypothetical protein